MTRQTLTALLLGVILVGCKEKKFTDIALESLKLNSDSYYTGFKGSFSISESGAVSYSLPLVVTPGVGGMTPQISLTYNSNNGTSIMGDGWALSGFSLISRSPNINAIDTFSQAITYDKNDKLSLDGQRLIHIKQNKDDNYGSENSIYATENNIFSKIRIEKSSNNINGISFISARTKSGIINRYGSDDGTGVLRTSTLTNTVPYLWLQTSSRDLNGNWINYQYDYSKQPYRPYKITYGGKNQKKVGEIEFIYDLEKDNEDDNWDQIKYVSGEVMQISSKLIVIITRQFSYNSDGEEIATQVKKYNIEYQYEVITNKLLVSKIFQSVDNDGFKGSDVRNAILFDYTRTNLYNKEFYDSLTLVTKENVSLDEDYKLTLSDLNRDGFPDKTMYKNYTDKVIFISALNNTQGNFIKSRSDTFQTKLSKDAIFFNGDFNADGRGDLGFIDYKDSKISLVKYEPQIDLNDNISFKETYQKDILDISFPDFKKVKYGTGDFNSDGYTDLIVYYTEKDSVKLRCFTSSKNGFIVQNSRQFGFDSKVFDECFNSVTDINGDGISDLLFTWFKDKKWKTYSVIFKNSRQLGIDFSLNQDAGDAEISTQLKTINIIDTTGASTGQPVRVQDEIMEGDYQKLGNIQFCDINKDGNIDLIASKTDIEGWSYSCALGKGNGKFNVVSDKDNKNTHIITRIKFNVNHRASFGDFNGDGNTDLVIQKSDADGWFNLVAYGDNRGNFNLGSEATSMILVYKNNFSYSQKHLTNNVFPVCQDYIFRSIPAENLKHIINITTLEGLMKNIWLQFPVETGYFPLSNNTLRPFQTVKSYTDLLPKSYNFDNGVKRITDLSLIDNDTSICLRAIKQNTKITFGDYWLPFVADLNGDGLSDLLLTYPRQVPNDTSLHINKNPLEDNLYTFVSINTNKKNYLLAVIQHSNKNIVKLEYASVLLNSDTANRKQISQLKYPFIPYTAPIYTVSKTLVSNGIGLDSFKTTKYSYSNGVFSLNGRGFLGFLSSKIENGNNGNYTASKYLVNNEFATMGLLPLASTYTYILDSISILIGKDTFNYELKKNGMTFSLYNTFKSSQAFDLNNVLLKTESFKTGYDKYGNVIYSLSANGQGANLITKEVTSSYYETSSDSLKWVTKENDKWIIGRLKATRIITKRNGNLYSDRVGIFEYNNTTGQLIKEVSDTSSKEFSLTKIYVHNAFGSITADTIFPTFNPSDLRTTSTDYTDDGRFVTRIIDPQGYITTKVTDKIYGYLISTTFANETGQTTSAEFNPLGYETTTRSADSIVSKTTQKHCDAGDMDSLATYTIIQENSQTNLPTITYYNNADMPIRKLSYDFLERQILVDYEYDIDGNLLSETLPYFETETKRFIRNGYDKLNRKIKTEFPNGAITEIRYDGLKDTTINAKGQIVVNEKNILGELVKAIDHYGYYVTYDYDAASRIKSITDKNGLKYEMEYDLNGNRISYLTPNFVKPELSKFDAWGNKIATKSPNNYNASVKSYYDRVFVYDKLNRLVSDSAKRTGFHHYTNYTYIQQKDNFSGKGKLLSITSNADDFPFEEYYTYYPSGQLKTKTYRPNNDNHDGIRLHKRLMNTLFSYRYDKGLLSEIDYPYYEGNTSEPFTLKYSYTNGTLTKTFSLNGENKETTYWRLDSTNALGATTKYFLGDSIVATNTFDSLVNNLTQVNYKNSNATLAGVNYRYDVLGNNIFRNDVLNTSLNDSITFDDLNRIIQVKTGNDSVLIKYKECGDIDEKTFAKKFKLKFNYVAGTNKYKSIQYTNLIGVVSKPFLYTKNIKYDSVGNQRYTLPIDEVNAKSFYIDFNQYNLPYSIGGTTNFRYAYDGSKTIICDQMSTGGVSLNGLAEYDIKNNVITEQRFNIIVGGKIIAIVKPIKDSKGKIISKIEYLLKDGMNTVMAKADDEAIVYQRFAYDVWGKLRDNKTWKYVFNDRNKRDLDRGFLNCFTLSGYGLLDFNARMYDPITGRFISVEPILSNRYTSTQFFGAYAYGLNNPAVFQDANGKFFWVAVIVGAYLGASAAGGSLLPWDWNENWWKGAIVGAAMGYAGAAFTPAAFGGGIGGAMASGATIGFIGGFTSTIVNGGNIGQAFESGFKGGVIGGVTAGFTYGIGEAFTHNLTISDARYFPKAVVHGLNQGLATEMSGGSFEHGFMAGTFTSLSTPLTNPSLGTPETRTLISGMVGGTASSLGGGKFANGALSGVYIQMYNEEMFSGTFAKPDLSNNKPLFKYKGEYQLGSYTAEALIPENLLPFGCKPTGSTGLDGSYQYGANCSGGIFTIEMTNGTSGGCFAAGVTTPYSVATAKIGMCTDLSFNTTVSLTSNSFQFSVAPDYSGWGVMYQKLENEITNWISRGY